MPHTVGVSELNPKYSCHGVKYDEAYLEEYEGSTSGIYFMNILGDSRGCMYLWMVRVKGSNLVKESILNTAFLTRYFSPDSQGYYLRPGKIACTSNWGVLRKISEIY